jgi:hypothetical protein
MRENMQDEDAFRPVVYSGDQSVVIAMNVEHGSPPHNIGVRKIISHRCERFPICSPGDPIPVHQRNQRVGVPFSEARDRGLADNPQSLVYET